MLLAWPRLVIGIWELIGHWGLVILMFDFSSIISLIALLLFIQVPFSTPNCPDFTESRLTVNNHKISIGIADEQPEQTKGLSGCEKMPQNSGLYFPYPEEQTPGFWMKDMLIPIDIVWIARGEVVGVEENVQPQPNIPDNQLRLYYPSQPITAVLELPAGKAANLGIASGAKIQP